MSMSMSMESKNLTTKPVSIHRYKLHRTVCVCVRLLEIDRHVVAAAMGHTNIVPHTICMTGQLKLPKAYKNNHRHNKYKTEAVQKMKAIYK